MTAIIVRVLLRRSSLRVFHVMVSLAIANETTKRKVGLALHAANRALLR